MLATFEQGELGSPTKSSLGARAIGCDMAGLPTAEARLVCVFGIRRFAVSSHESWGCVWLRKALAIRVRGEAVHRLGCWHHHTLCVKARCRRWLLIAGLPALPLATLGRGLPRALLGLRGPAAVCSQRPCAIFAELQLARSLKTASGRRASGNHSLSTSHP